MFSESEATRMLELCTSVGFIPVQKLKPRKAKGHAQGCSTGLWPSWTQVLPLHPCVLRFRPAKVGTEVKQHSLNEDLDAMSKSPFLLFLGKRSPSGFKGTLLNAVF